MTPSVVALFVCKASRAPLQPMERVEAILETGLQGDRHAKRDSRRQVLLMEQETLDQLGLAPGQVREQVTVRGLGLERLPFGTRIRVGGALLEVANPCQPCERMEELRAGLKETLVGRRGRFVRVVEAGTFAVGDPLIVEPPA
jgi:MOSC domain-containing protein YiiM